MTADRKKRVTHRDVARRANVSTAVVSYVINNGPRATSPEARERVLKAIADLDYHPHAFARSLRAQRTQMVGYIAHDLFSLDVFVSRYSAGILTGVMAELKEHDHYLLVYPQVIDDELSALDRLLRSGRLDGVVVRLIQDPPATDRLMETIAATGVPCVCIERPCHPRYGCTTVTYDDVLGGTLATTYLAEQGRRRIAHLSGDPRYVSAQGRLQGYQDALKAAGLPNDDTLIQCYSWDTADVTAAMDRLLALPEPPDAIFAASDDLALAVLDLLHARGYRVPDDIAVIGFDDIQMAAYSVPPLTTIRIPLVELGRRAAQLVLNLNHADVTQPAVVPVELIRRASA